METTITTTTSAPPPQSSTSVINRPHLVPAPVLAPAPPMRGSSRSKSKLSKLNASAKSDANKAPAIPVPIPPPAATAGAKAKASPSTLAEVNRNGGGGDGGSGASKPKQSKSRNGCITCKQKRLKCDETKPACQQCSRRNVQCEGYKRDFKWRAFEETTLATKPILTPRTKKSSAGTDIAISHRFESREAAFKESGGSTTTISAAFSQSAYHLLPPSTHPAQAQLPSEPIQDAFDQSPVDHALYVSQSYLPPLQFQRNNSQSVSSSCTVDSGIEVEPSLQAQSFIRPNVKSGQSPRLIDLLEPGTDLRATPPEFKNYSAENSSYQYQPGGYSYTQSEQMTPLDDDVEEIIRQPQPTEAWGLNVPSPSPSNSSSSTEGFSSNTPTFMSRQPQLHPGSPEMLMMRFDRQTCGILSVKDGPTENPWRTMVWPLARDSPALYHAISSMTAFHSSQVQPRLRVVGIEHMKKSIRFLADGLKTMQTDIALATTLVLAFAESWDQHISSGTEHLRGARILLNQAVTRHRQHSLNVNDFERLKFLFNTWIYMDVIARLTCLDDDDSEFFDAVLSNPFGPPNSYQNVDPLMGCATTLFPLIGRVANLIRKVRKSSTNSINIISQANELKAALKSWQPPLAFEAPEDPTSDIEHSLQTAEAYRWATLLYLHQAVPEIPFKSAAQLAKRALVYLATVPLTSRTIIVQIYPLLAAGCEASSDEDRTWVKDRWEAMMSRMLIGNLDRCWEVVQEVWSRRDADEAERNHPRLHLSPSRMEAGSEIAGAMNQKRKFRGDQDILWDDGSDSEYGWAKRRATGEPSRSDVESGEVEYLPRRNSIDTLEDITFDRTVRGRLHWIGVMKDWKWEGRACGSCGSSPLTWSTSASWIDRQATSQLPTGAFCSSSGKEHMVDYHDSVKRLPSKRDTNWIPRLMVFDHDHDPEYFERGH